MKVNTGMKPNRLRDGRPRGSICRGRRRRLAERCGCDVEAVRIPALEQNNYFDPAITLYGAELGRYVLRFVGDWEAELHFAGKIYVSSPDPSLADYIDADKDRSAQVSVCRIFSEIQCTAVPSHSFYGAAAGT